MSMRWLSGEAVDEGQVERLVWAATRASNPGNSQLWDFVVVREASVRAQLAGLISETLSFRSQRPEQQEPEKLTARQDAGVTPAMKAGVDHLIDRLAAVPVIMFICGTNAFPPEAPSKTMMFSAVHGAAQELSWLEPAPSAWVPRTPPFTKGASQQ